MKRHWQVSRAEQPCPDGQRRWDRAYQLLLDWAAGPPAEPSRPSPLTEITDASRRLRPRLDPAPDPDPDD